MNIGYYLEAAARAHPERPAVSLGTERRWTYAGFLARIARLAAGLRALPGVGAGDRVALAMKNCPQYLELLSAAWHAGLCTVPVNAQLHPREFEYILGNSGARLCFATPDLSGELARLVGRIEPLAQVIDVESDAYARLFADTALPLQQVDAEAPAWLFYTSGTTGRPKGATLTHRSLAAMTWRYYADVDALGDRDCIIHAAPLSHATGLYSLPHTAKASHQVIPASQGVDLDEIFDLLDTYDNVTLFAAPTMLTRMVARAGQRRVRIDAIKTIFYGGAPMYVEDLKRALACFGPRLWQGFGQGEMPNTICCLSKARHAETAHPKFEERLTTVGVPRTGVEVRVVDADDRDVPTGEIGEVIARSDVCMSGYWNNPSASAATLRGGWLHTGDLGAFDADGFLTLKDRSKDVIISGGSNIYPREVEEVLLTHPDVLEASVVGRRHPDWGEEVVAFVVPRPSRAVAEADLDRLCLANIARFKRPKAYFTIEALPKNNYGKVLKTELRERLKAMGNA